MHYRIAAISILTLLAAASFAAPPPAPADSLAAAPPGRPLRLADDDPNVLFADSFESGISPAWLAVSKGVEVVPEDPNRPEGNHVARLTEFRQSLASPPPRDANQPAYDAWADYEFSFRFRLHRVVDQPARPGNVGTFLNVAWRIHPAEDNPSERQIAFIQSWRHRGTFRLSGPLAVWYGANRGYEAKNVNRVYPAAVEGVKLDAAWHRFSVRCQGERVRVYFDGRLFFDGTDDRVLDGGVSVSYWWDASRYIPAPIDIDDVAVRRLPPQDAGLAAAGPDAGTDADALKPPELATAWPVDQPPKIDGKLDDPAWSAVRERPDAALDGWVTVGQRPRPISQQRTAWLACDEKNLYIALRVPVGDANMLAAYENDAKPGDTLRADFAGAACGVDSAGKNIQIILPYVLPTRQACATDGGVWTCELAIPWSDIGGRPKTGQTVPFNLAGHDSSIGRVSWSHVRDFRDVKHFAKLRVGK